MTDYSDWKYIFKTSWCPVLGEIPGNDYSPQDKSLPDNPLDRLALIIKEARELLEIDVIDPAIFGYDHPPLNVPKEDYTEAILSHCRVIEIAATNAPAPTLAYVKLLRSIFGSTRCIYQYIDSYKYHKNNKYTQKVVASARDIFCPELPAFIILAVLAIQEAYTQAYSLVVYDKAPDTSKSTFLLGEAQKSAVDKKITDLELEASAYRKQSSGFRDSNEKSETRGAIKKEIIWKWAEEIRAEDQKKYKDTKPTCDEIIKRIENGDYLPNEVEKVKVHHKDNPPTIPTVKNLQHILTGF